MHAFLPSLDPPTLRQAQPKEETGPTVCPFFETPHHLRAPNENSTCRNCCLEGQADGWQPILAFCSPLVLAQRRSSAPRRVLREQTQDTPTMAGSNLLPKVRGKRCFQARSDSNICILLGTVHCQFSARFGKCQASRGVRKTIKFSSMARTTACAGPLT